MATSTTSAPRPTRARFAVGRPGKARTPAARWRPVPPRADLLPPVWKAREAGRTARRRSGALCALAALVVAGVYGYGVLDGHQVDQQTATEQGRASTLARDLAVYAPVTNLKVQTDHLTTTVQEQTSSAVDYSQVLSRFMTAVSSTMTVTSLQLATGADTTCASADPFVDQQTAGCLTFTGTASGTGGASATVAALSHDEWFLDAFVPNVGTDSAGHSTLSGSVALSVSAFATPPSGSDGSTK